MRRPSVNRSPVPNLAPAARHPARAALSAGLLVLALLAGCAQPPVVQQPEAADQAFWSGRLALRVEGVDQQSFSAGFELKGAPAQGELKLLSPLGSTLALVQWTGEGASLQTNREQRKFDSLDLLLQQVTGTALPVRTLFDWLAGRDTALPGWQADLAGLGDGRLSAQRLEPPPTVRLRLLLDRDAQRPATD
jgi:outer membrane lipoprotein LolB